MATYTFDTNTSQETALTYFANKEALKNDELFQRIVLGAFQSYESSLADQKNQDLVSKYNTLSVDKKAQIDLILSSKGV